MGGMRPLQAAHGPQDADHETQARQPDLPLSAGTTFGRTFGGRVSTVTGRRRSHG